MNTRKAFPDVPEARRRMMGRVRDKDSKPELLVRKLAHRLGYRFRLHRRDLPGTPDLVFPARKKVVLVHGCFWHRHEGCARTTSPKTRSYYWQTKFAENVQRDRRQGRELAELGWDVLVLWECEVLSPDLALRLTEFLGS